MEVGVIGVESRGNWCGVGVAIESCPCRPTRVGGLIKPQPKHYPYINRVKNLNPNPHTSNMCNPFMTRVTRLNKVHKKI